MKWEPSPTPWRKSSHGDGAAIADADGHRIASLRYKGASISARVTPEECHANQHLMIAAPNLLAALKRAVAVLDADGSPLTTHVVRVALEAIRQAEGGAS